MCTANLADANKHIFDWAILGMNYSSEQLVKMFMNIYHSSVALLSKSPNIQQQSFSIIQFGCIIILVDQYPQIVAALWK